MHELDGVTRIWHSSMSLESTYGVTGTRYPNGGAVERRRQEGVLFAVSSRELGEWFISTHVYLCTYTIVCS